MSDIELSNSNELAKAIPDEQLRQHGISVDALKATVQEADSTSIEAVSASIGAEAVLTIQGFNSTTDKHDAGVLGLAGAANAEELGPSLYWEPMCGWSRSPMHT